MRVHVGRSDRRNGPARERGRGGARDWPDKREDWLSGLMNRRFRKEEGEVMDGDKRSSKPTLYQGCGTMDGKHARAVQWHAAMTF